MEKLTIRNARMLADMTQVEMAEALGVNEGTYIDYEKYRTFMRMDTAYKFSKIVNRSLDELIFLPDNYILNVPIKSK